MADTEIMKPMEGYESRWDYWKKEFPRALGDEKNTLYLLDTMGKDTHIKAYLNLNYYPEPTFTCSARIGKFISR